MARIISVTLLLLIMMMALVSRKNYSKYKAGRDPLWWVAGWITYRFSPEVKDRVKSYIRKINVLNKKPLDTETDRWLSSMLHSALVLTIVLLFLVIILSFIPEDEIDPYIVERPGVKEPSTYVDVKLVDETNTSGLNYSLEIHAREYSEEEFRELVERTRVYLDSTILGENSDKDHVRKSLSFPSRDETETLSINWDTSSLTTIDYEGNVNNDEVGDIGKDVEITATISDGHYSETYQIVVKVVKDTELSGSEKAKLKMLEIEEGNRSLEELELPHQIGDVKVERKVSGRDETYMKFLMFGLILIILYGYYRVYKLKEQGKERDKELEDAYFGFVNRLTIFLGAGFGLRKAIEAAVERENCVSLKEEVEFMLSMIRCGTSESKAYSDLGKRLGSEQYMRLMSLISQNLSYGNSNLLRLLDTEVRTGFYLRREHIRKKGEQASEKLLIPTGILLGLVMVIVMYPALIGL